MANPVVQTAVCTCSFGMAPMVLPVTSQQTVTICGMPAATVLDNKCTTFGMCGKPLLNNTSKLMCSYGGVIQVTVTPAVTVQTP